MRADGVVVLVLDRDVERRAGRAALLGRREQRRPFDRVPHLVAEAEVVDHGRPVLDVAVEPDERALADPLGRTRRGAPSARSRQERPERLAVALDERLEVRDVAAGERVRDDGAGGDETRRRLDRLAALAHDVLDDRHDLAQTVERHRASITALRTPIIGRWRRSRTCSTSCWRRPGRAGSRSAATCPARRRSRSSRRRSRPVSARSADERSVHLPSPAGRARGAARPAGRPGRLRRRLRRSRVPAMLEAYGGLAAQIVTPVLREGRLEAILSLHQLGAPRRWTEDEIATASTHAAERWRASCEDPRDRRAQPLAPRPRAGGARRPRRRAHARDARRARRGADAREHARRLRAARTRARSPADRAGPRRGGRAGRRARGGALGYETPGLRRERRHPGVRLPRRRVHGAVPRRLGARRDPRALGGAAGDRGAGLRPRRRDRRGAVPRADGARSAPARSESARPAAPSPTTPRRPHVPPEAAAGPADDPAPRERRQPRHPPARRGRRRCSCPCRCPARCSRSATSTSRRATARSAGRGSRSPPP